MLNGHPGKIFVKYINKIKTNDNVPDFVCMSECVSVCAFVCWCECVCVCVCLLTPSPLKSANDNVLMGRVRVCVCAYVCHRQTKKMF